MRTMTILGLPFPMFMVFVVTILAGSLGAIHYTIVHIVLGKPFGDEGDRHEKRQGLGRQSVHDGIAGREEGVR